MLHTPLKPTAEIAVQWNSISKPESQFYDAVEDDVAFGGENLCLP